MFIKLDQLATKEIIPGFFGKFIHTANVTIGHFTVKAGSVLPEHAHPHEQTTNLLEGELEMTVGGQTNVCKAGDVIVIPPNVKHAGKALTDCRLIDVFQPVREDYRF